MKAKEAPEKLYLHPTAKGEVGASWLTFPLTDNDIEYTRTDSFIEKALNWLKEHADDYDYTWYDETVGESGITDKMIEDFRKYMEE